MPQTYAQRKAARPHWARYKNTKKALRRRVQRGSMTEEERARQQELARVQYLLDDLKEQGIAWDPELARVAQSGGCWLTCALASGPKCRCECGGVGHGRLA